MKKLDDLVNWFDGRTGAIVSLSGGVDSGLVAYAAFQKLKSKVIAVTADYKTLSKEELESAKKICSEIGIQQVVISYDELENADFVKNDKNRCFFCRSELASHLKEIADKKNIDLIVDGTNLDDLGDYRPGIAALNDAGIRSPLVDVGFSKDDVRQAAKSVDLSFYDKPSNSCLASRIPWGQRVTAERLARIEVGEAIVKQIIPARQVRVRDLDGVAKIEVNIESVPLISEKILNELYEKLFLIGFRSVVIDPEGYKSGKLNVI